MWRLVKNSIIYLQYFWWIFHKRVLSVILEYQIETIKNELKFNWTSKDNIYNFPYRDLIQTFHFNYYNNGSLPTRSELINVPEAKNTRLCEKKSSDEFILPKEIFEVFRRTKLHGLACVQFQDTS